MSQIQVEVEENRNCPYSPLQVFETLGEVRTAREVRLAGTGGADAPQGVVGWSSAKGGSPCPVRYVEVSDSGGGASLLMLGGDFGIRIRQADSPGPWDLADGAQWGEAYLLLDPRIAVTPLDDP